MRTIKLFEEMGLMGLIQEIIACEDNGDGDIFQNVGGLFKQGFNNLVDQTSTLIFALERDEEVVKAIKFDLARGYFVGEESEEEEEGRVRWKKYRKYFATLTGILLRICEDLAGALNLVGEVIKGREYSRYRDYLEEIWGHVIKNTLEDHRAEWVMGSQTVQDGRTGWWVSDKITGLKFFMIPYHLPDRENIRLSIFSQWWANMGAETCAEICASFHKTLVETFRPRLVRDAWRLIEEEEVDLENLSRSELRELERKVRYKTKLEAWDELCLGEMEYLIDELLYPS